ncbi:hypothetical protein [Acanthopleuribacter pedis]|uniref:Uncharacterized protein n=1 Tax=Acanthopleuribacter pedis TaxID=442870 RepID=A0A8J7Q7P3_9BACT|nr:hypothetical protein [Acanthopleuribacter pedis]MBO1318364.1 hypothetical protein [Acanthopleuribacter pedis]
MSDLFYEKKQLLEQRDELLQDIGLTMFMSGDLPEGFQKMPREFASMELLVRQLGDRYRVMKEERDRQHIDYTELINKTAKIEGGIKKKQAPLRHDLDEINIKIRFIHDQQAQNKRINDEQLDELEAQSGRLQADIAKLENEKNTELERLRAEIDPLERRLEKLDKGIRKVEEEELQLSLDGKKRLQDLGTHYYRQRRDEAFYGDKYEQLDELRDRLAVSKRQPDYQFGGNATQRRSEHHYWLYAMLLGVLLGVWLFRTTYEHQEVSMAAIAGDYLRDEVADCFYGNLELAPIDLRDQIPDLQSLPGGHVFNENDQNRLSEFALGRDNSEQLQFCGLRFREAPTRLSTRWAQAGWVYVSNEGGFLSMAKDDWLWLGLNDTTFLLMQKARLADFLATSFGSSTLWYLRRAQFPPFGYNEPLLQGFGRYELRLQQDQFDMVLAPIDRQVELEQRAQRLKHLEAHQQGGTIQIRREENRLAFSGARNLLPEGAYRRADTLRDTLSRLTRHWAANTPKEALLAQAARHEIPALPPPRDVPGSPTIQVFAHNPMGLSLRGEIAANHPITGMAFANQRACLLLTDAERGLLSEYHFNGHNLQRHRSRNLAQHPIVQTPFHPSQLSLTPDEQFALVFEQQGRDRNRPKMMLVRMDDLEPVLVADFPEGVREGHCAAWDPGGTRLFLGVQGRVRRNGTALGALTYRREHDVLNLLRFIDVPAEKQSKTRVSALFFDDKHNSLLLLRKPSDELVRFHLDRKVNQNLEWILLDQNRRADDAPETLRRGHLLPTRDGAHAVTAVDTSDQSSVIHLIGLESETLRLEDQLPIDGVAGAMKAVPLRNQYWLALPSRKTLAAITVSGRQLSYRTLVRFDHHRPHALVSDRWGDFVFVASYQDDLD